MGKLAEDLHAEHSSSFQCLLPLVSVALATIVLVLDPFQWSPLPRRASGSARRDGDMLFEFPHVVDDAIATVTWDPTDQNFAELVMLMREPVLIRNTPSQAWPALREFVHWPTLTRSHAEFMARARDAKAKGRDDDGEGEEEEEEDAPAFAKAFFEELRMVKSAPERLVCPANVRAGQIPSVLSRRDTYSLHNMTLGEFLFGACGVPAPHYRGLRSEPFSTPAFMAERHMYYSGPVPSRLREHVSPVEPFEIRSPSSSSSTAQSQSESAVNLWLAEDGLIGNLHFDRSYNMVVQLQGGKTWTLFPPGDIPLLYMYPSVHPHYQSSQIDFFNDDALKYFPKAARAHGVRVRTKPGDVLYVPPFWPHLVEHHAPTRGVSASVSIVSPSYEERQCSRLDWVRLPFEASWPIAERAPVVLAYLERLADLYFDDTRLHTVPGGMRVNSLVRFSLEVLVSRFEHLMEGLLAYTSSAMQTLTDGEGRCQLEPVSLGADLAASIDKSASEVVAVLKELRERSKPPPAHQQGRGRRRPYRRTHRLSRPFSVADTCLANFVERLSVFAVGARNVAFFMQSCFVHATNGHLHEEIKHPEL